MATTTKGKITFYRPHKRVTYSGRLTDLNTGEQILPEVRVKQSFVAECDINNILKQFKVTGMVRHMSAKAAQGAYVNLPEAADFQESLNIVIEGQKAFATLPSLVRERFQNDPEQFLAFMADPKNQDEAIKLGLATDKRPPARADENGGGDRNPPAPPAAAAAAPKPTQPPAGTTKEPSE